MIGDGTGMLTSKIEVGVLREIERSGLVRNGLGLTKKTLSSEILYVTVKSTVPGVASSPFVLR